MLCERVGDFPVSGWWQGPCEIDNLACESVQALPTTLRSLPWAVVAFVERRQVNGRWPVLGARDALEAVRLTKSRGLQVGKVSRLEVVASGYWRAGRAIILAQAALARVESGSFAGSRHD